MTDPEGDDVCRYVRRTWEDGYAVDDMCMATPHRGPTHGPWVLLPGPTPADAARQAQEWGRLPVTPPTEDQGDEQRCVAHGKTAHEHVGAYANDCTAIPKRMHITGGCWDCEVYAETGMHWDTCPQRGRNRAAPRPGPLTDGHRAALEQALIGLNDALAEAATAHVEYEAAMAHVEYVTRYLDGQAKALRQVIKYLRAGPPT